MDDPPQYTPTVQAGIKARSGKIWQDLAKVLASNKDITILVEGHTDNVPISNAAFPSNWHLSVARALNTAYYLVNKENLAADKISIVGFSEYKPIETNETPAGRASNRRVDIVIIK